MFYILPYEMFGKKSPQSQTDLSKMFEMRNVSLEEQGGVLQQLVLINPLQGMQRGEVQ